MNNIIENITNPQEREIYLKYSSILPIDVVSFARKLGLEVKESRDLPQTISGFIKQAKDGVVFICVNERHHINRKRFTVAHELGHYFLHNDKLLNGIVENRLDRSNVRNQIEKEADAFAGNLLMPEQKFKEWWENKCCAIEDIADYFRVSVDAVTTRARCLKLLT